MTLINPSLFLNRLIVFYNGKTIYDEKFNKGVNIICGENSSGKSTITELIFFALGGEVSRWKKEASMCDSVYAEVIINGAFVTLKRDISTKQRRPMGIFWGAIADALRSTSENWQQYSFQRSDSKESFSQCLFRALKLPEVRGDGSSNITMHQILRIIYCDQMTPADRIFRFEQFDSALHRRTIGDLLCGIYSNELYEKQLSLEEKNKLFESLRQKLSSIHTILGAADQELSVTKIEEDIHSLEHERVSLYNELEQCRKNDKKQQEKPDQDVETKLRNQLSEIRQEVNALKSKKDQLEFEIADSLDFVNVIQTRISALKQSGTIRSSLGEMNFHFCPACLSLLSDTVDEENCVLCKNRKENGRENSYYLMLHQELEEQAKESKHLLRKREVEVQKINLILPGKISHAEEAESRLNSFLRSSSSESEIQVEELNRKIGYIDRSIENAHEKARLLSLINDIIEEKSKINSDISRLNDEINAIKEDLKYKKEKSYLEISELTRDILTKDLDRENEFQHADIISFDFGDDNISVDGKRQFSASSMVYLKNSLHLAFLWAATNNSFFNYPRLAIFDNIEDKGMEQERSHNFQKIILSISENITVEHQIIFATSMVVPELKQSTLVVGDYHTHSRKSLRFA
jgi:hypothetical protein